MKNNQKLLSILFHQKLLFFCVCMDKMVDISAEVWNKADVSLIRVHENDDVNKTVLLLLCISDASKRWGGKNLYNLIDKEIKGKYGVKNMGDLTKP